MPVQYKSVADGQLANAQAAIATPASGKQWAGVRVHLFNTNTTEEVIIIAYSRDSGSNKRTVARITLLENERQIVVVPMQNDTSQILYGHTTTAAKVNYVVEAIEADTT
jgi:hypothetical protein